MLDNLNGLSNVARLDGFEGFSLQVKRNPKLSNACGIIPIITYDPSYVQVYPSINSNSANTSSVQDIIANCNTCKIYEGNLILTSQAQVDTFDYCEITGNLTIQEDVAGDITDLSSLATLETLGGGLYFKSNTSITNLDAFHNLKMINGSLELSKNAILANIDGLSGLEIINGNLVISINKKITSLRAFNTLTTLNGNLNLLANEGLTDLDGFVNLKQIGGFLEIKGHRSMVSFTGLSNLTTIGTDIRIIGNDLSNLDGLTKLNEIKGNLELTNNFKLSDINVFANVFSIKELRIKNNNLTDLSGFSGLKDAGAIILNNCDITNLNDLSNLTSLANRLVLYNNKNLENISGISNAIGKNIIQLEIGGNPNLRSLTGLENLEIISSFVSIFNNQKLKNLDALSNMTKITKNLGIRHNSGLENACGIVQLLENETAVGGLTIIETNGVNTSTVETIIEYCDTNRIFNGDITILTQKDVDTFKYAKIIGNLTIQESSAAAIRNLDGLASLTSVLGNILIKNNVALSTLDGLTSLNTVEGEFAKIRSNLSDPFTSITQISPEYLCEPIQPENVFENRDGKSYARSDENIIIEKLPAQIKSKEKIILYPTIIDGNSVTLSGIKNNFTYSVFSASVQLIDSEEVKSGTQEKTIVFDKQLTSGMYFLRIQEEGGKIVILRFMVK